RQHWGKKLEHICTQVSCLHQNFVKAELDQSLKGDLPNAKPGIALTLIRELCSGKQAYWQVLAGKSRWGLRSAPLGASHASHDWGIFPDIETLSEVFMFKRNQVEDAIARVLQRGSTRLNSEMRSRVKRLLEIDRARGRNKRSNDPEQANFAFHGADTPGRGNENVFSDYETFALST